MFLFFRGRRSSWAKSCANALQFDDRATDAVSMLPFKLLLDGSEAFIQFMKSLRLQIRMSSCCENIGRKIRDNNI